MFETYRFVSSSAAIDGDTLYIGVENNNFGRKEKKSRQLFNDQSFVATAYNSGSLHAFVLALHKHTNLFVWSDPAPNDHSSGCCPYVYSTPAIRADGNVEIDRL